MHTFTSHGYDYLVHNNGVIEQIDPQSFCYDAQYVAIYNTEAYRRGNETLQALRYGFLVAAHGHNPVSLLDIGCGNGAFLKFTQQHCTNVKGYDVTGSEVDGVETVQHLTPASVWTFWDVLEHIYDCSFLANADCETICISLPYCWYYLRSKEWFDHEYKHRKPNEHIRHFNPASLRSFMLRYGWINVAQGTHEDIIRTSAHGLPNILSMAFKRGGK